LCLGSVAPAVQQSPLTLAHQRFRIIESAFLVVIIGTLLLYLSDRLEGQAPLWVPAAILTNLQITTFFFVAGLILLEKDEGTLSALAVSPLSPATYLTMRILGLTILAAAETVAVVWLGFGAIGRWPFILVGTAALGIIYTAFGAAFAVRYDSVNAFLLPASVVILLLMLPLLPHFGLTTRGILVLHPLEPALTLLRGGFDALSRADTVFGIVGSAAWSAIAFAWAQRRVQWLMRHAYSQGGR
jgi:fluoroquinolone transport system permease protein